MPRTTDLQNPPRWKPLEEVESGLGGWLEASDRTRNAFDPYLIWATLTHFGGYSNVPRTGNSRSRYKLPVALQIRRGRTSDLDTLVGAATIPLAYKNFSGIYCTSIVELDSIRALAEDPTVVRVELGLPLPRKAMPNANPEREPARRGGEDSDLPVIGVIDIGCAFLNRAFWESKVASEGSRIRSLWQQDVAPTEQWKRPAGFGYGRELCKSEINEMLLETQGDPRREREKYKKLKYLFDRHGLLERQGHGTHVLDTLAGRVVDRLNSTSSKPDKDDHASSAELIFVDVPRQPERDSTGASICAQIIDALHYIVDRASAAKSIVVNISIGAQAGPHDGSSIIECAIDELVNVLRQQKRRLVVVMAAGNGYKSKCHAEGRLEAGKPAEFDWRVLPDDTTDNCLEIWYDRNGSGGADDWPEIEVVAPSGQSSEHIKPGKGKVLVDQSDGAIATVLHCKNAATGDGPMVLVAISPTGRVNGRAKAPHGLWKVKIRNGSSSPRAFYAWVERDDPPVGMPRKKRQSYLIDSTSRKWVTGAGTLNNIATGKEAVVVAATDRVTRRVSPYCAARSEIPPAEAQTMSLDRRRVPDVKAPADETPAFGGLVAAGVLSGQAFRMGGTSVASPVAARAIYNALLSVQSPTRAQIKLLDLLNVPFDGPRPPENIPPQSQQKLPPNDPSSAIEVDLS